MDLNDKIDHHTKIAGFRYALIAELTNRNLSENEIKGLIREKAKRTYHIPYSTKTKITAKSIRRWLKSFLTHGMDGITPRVRDDLGKCKKLTPQEIDNFKKYLSEKPYLTAKTAFKDCLKKGLVEHEISSSALSRLVLSNGLDKKNRMALLNGIEDYRKFNFRYPLECVQADFMHGFEIPDHNGVLKKAKLLSFIDDATRRILYAVFTFHETAEEFEKGLKSILTVYGKIQRVYVDNGASFICSETKRILDVLGIPIIHSRPYKPQGRGKKERFFRTLREQFLSVLEQKDIKSIAHLNFLLKTWLETEYHRNPHGGLAGKCPLDAWLENTKYLIPIPPSIDLNEAFLHCEKRKVYQDSTFSLDALLYEVPSILIGKKITVKFDPHLTNRPIKVYLDQQYICDAKVLDSYANTKVKRNKPQEMLSDKNADQSASVVLEKKTASIQYALNASQIDL
jgi:transposase InsO family protein